MTIKQASAVLCAAAALCARADAPADTAMQDTTPFHVRVAKWRGDAKGAVSFYYDDGTDSSFDFVRPVLVKYHVPGTFYICAGWFKGGEDDPKLARWSCARDFPEIVLGDHTFTHGGVTNLENFVSEIERNGAILRRIAGLPPDAPLSFALPGGVAWKITPEEQEKALAEHNEALRHDFGPNIGGDGHGQFAMSDFGKAVKALDRAEAEGSWQSLLFHGVGGDWLRYPAADHEKLIRETAARVAQGRLWAGAESEVRRYSLARDAAKVDAAGPDAGADSDFFQFVVSVAGDAPRDVSLTLVADVPQDWVSATVEAPGAEPFKRPVIDGKATFDIPPLGRRVAAVTLRKCR